MRFLSEYKSIKGYLERFTILKFGKLHIRIHNILSSDKTSFYHNHPFKYLSVVFKGGYTESYLDNSGVPITVARKAPCVVLSSEKRYHRIESVLPETKTLFLTYGSYDWFCVNKGSGFHKNGLYYSSEHGYCKRIDDIYYIGSECITKALTETRHSIFQVRDDCTLYSEIN